MAALVAPRPQDGPARPGGHAMAKAVTLCSFAIVRLIRALHCVLFCGLAPGERAQAVRMAAGRARRRERSGARAGAAPGVTVEDDRPDRQSARCRPDISERSRDASHGTEIGRKSERETPWMPVDRVLRCPGHGRRRGPALPLPDWRLLPDFLTLRDISETIGVAGDRRHSIFVHRVWT